MNSSYAALFGVAAALFAAGGTVAAGAQNAVKVEEKVQYLGKPNNIRLSNDTVELILTTDYGPRIMRYALVDSGDAGNVFATLTSAKPNLHTAYGDWFIYGGHRLWHAPESVPRSYVPDNEAITYTVDGSTVKLSQPVEKQTQIQKDMWVTLDPTGSHVTVEHRLTNRGPFASEMACWALSAMNKGGMAIFPQEPYHSHDEVVEPARALTLWGYTDLTDPRFFLGKAFITLKQDANATNPQKIGMLNKQGWGAYSLGTMLFIKRFKYEPGRSYPDYNANAQTYTDASFLELETLGPLTMVQPNQTLSYTEEWWLKKNVNLGTGEAGIAAAMLPIVTETAGGK